MPKRLRYFLQRVADLQGAALRLFLQAVEQSLRAHSPSSGPAARLGAVAFIHRFGSSLNAHLHFHCVVIDGVFDATTTGGIIFTAATGVDVNAIADVQARVRRGLLPGDEAQAVGQWQHGGGFSVDGSVCIEAADRAGRERRLRYDRRKSPVGTALGHRSPSNDCANSMATLFPTTAPNPVRAGPARSA